MVCLIVCLMVCLMVWLCSGGLYQSEFYLFIKEWKKVEAEAPGSGRVSLSRRDQQTLT